MDNNQTNKPEQEKQKKKGIIAWWHNIGTFGRVAICCLTGAAVVTAIVVPTVIAINKNKSIDATVELSEGITGISIASKKKLDNGALEITLKLDEGKELASVDKIVIGNQELKINDDYTLVGNVITINKDVIEKHKGEKIVITPKVKDKEVHVTSVKLNKNELTLKIGDKETLTATVYPSNATNKNVKFKSDNTTIASINEATGEITANAKGNATITVTSVDQEKTDTCIVSVTQDITGTVTITGEAEVGNTLTANYVGTETVSYQWYRGNVVISGATNSTYEIVSDDVGNTIKVKAIGKDGYSGSVTSTPTKVIIAYYNIDWSSNEFDLGDGDAKLVYTYAKKAKKIVFVQSDDVESGTWIGETSETTNPVYGSWDNDNSILKIWSRGKIKFKDNDRLDDKGFFQGCKSLVSLDLSNIDTSEVTNFYYCFYGCNSISCIDVSPLDTRSATDMRGMFHLNDGKNVLSEIKGLYNLNTSNVVDMAGMFRHCRYLTSLDLSHFDTSKVTTFEYMFKGCSNLTSLDLTSFDTKSAVSTGAMFYECTNLNTILVSNKFDISGLESGETSQMFYRCASIKGQAGTEYNDEKTDKEYARVDGGTSNPGYLTTIYKVNWLDEVSFSDGTASSPSEIPILFNMPDDLTKVVIGRTSDYKDIPSSGFSYAVIGETADDLITAYVDTTDYVVYILSNGRIWFEDNDIPLYNIFINYYNCSTMDLSNMYTKGITDFSYMFNNMQNLSGDLDLTSFDTGSATTFLQMFTQDIKLNSINLSSFDTHNCKEFTGMLVSLKKLRSIYVSDKFIISNDAQSKEMFQNSTAIIGGEGTTYNQSKTDKEYAHIDGGVSNPGYFTDISNKLIYSGSGCTYSKEYIKGMLTGRYVFRFNINENDKNGCNALSLNYLDDGTNKNIDLDLTDFEFYVNGTKITSGVEIIKSGDNVYIKFPYQKIANNDIRVVINTLEDVKSLVTAKTFDTNA